MQEMEYACNSLNLGKVIGVDYIPGEVLKWFVLQ